MGDIVVVTRADSLYGRQLGEFTLRERLGDGGYGSVYRCEQSALSREAVVKVLHRRVSDDFTREAHLASRLDHPYAAHVYAIGAEDDGVLWIAMELVRGVTLGEWLEKHGPMPLDQFVPIFERVAQVIQSAHARGIIHRDLKPDNVMLVERAGETLPKLLDFGIARLVDDSVPEDPDSVLGSPVYLAPEVWRGSPASTAADLYSLGVIAFEALTGRWPFRGDSADAIGRLHLKGPIPLTGLSAGIDRIFQRALAKDPEDRFDSALDLARAFRAEVNARRAAEEQIRRKRAVRRVGGVLGGVLAIIVFGVFQGRARYETRIAQQEVEDARALTRATALTAEIEQGRAALLHDDLAEAQRHLGEAWRMGERSDAIAFMYARALQPLRAEIARLSGTGRMWSASWSPDGARIATTDDHGAQIWDAGNYQRLSPLPHGDVVYAAAWLDAERLVTACGDGSVRIWNARKGTLLRELRLHGEAPRWYVVAVSPDGERVAAVDAKGGVAAAWETGSGAMLAELALDHSEWPQISFSADGRWLAATGGDQVQVVDAATWRSVLTIPGPRIRAVAWDPTGPRLVTGSAAGAASTWSLPVGTRLHSLHESGEAVDAVAWSPDGARIALAVRGGTEQIFDADGESLNTGNHLDDKVLSIEFDRTSQLVLAASVNGSAAVTEAATGLPMTVLKGPDQQLRVAHFGPVSRRVVGASWDGTARVWDATSPYRRWTAAPVGSECGQVGGVDPDGRYVAVGCVGHPTRVWDTTQDHLLASLPALVGDLAPFPAVSPGGEEAAIARGNTAELYGLPGGQLVCAVAHVARVTAIALGPGGELVSGDASGAILVSRGTNKISLVAVDDSGIDALALLPGDRVAAADARNRVRILPGGPEFDVGIRARMLRPAPDGRSLLVVPNYSGRTAVPVLVDLERGTKVQLDGPRTYTARWVPGGILTSHADGAARLWSVDGQLLRTYRGGPRFLVDAAMTADGSKIVGGGGDGSLRFWDAATSAQLWTMPAHSVHVLGIHLDGDDVVTRGFGGELSRWRLPNPDGVIKHL